MTDDLCNKCGIGMILPSGRCDHCNLAEQCQHIFNAHRQCQWCHRMQKDIDYEDGSRDLRDLLKLVAPQIEPLDSLSGMVSQINNFIAGHKEEIARLRATPIQWRPVDDLARDKPVLAKMHSGELLVVLWYPHTSRWYEASEQPGECNCCEYEDGDFAAYCPLTNPT